MRRFSNSYPRCFCMASYVPITTRTLWLIYTLCRVSSSPFLISGWLPGQVYSAFFHWPPILTQNVGTKIEVWELQKKPWGPLDGIGCNWTTIFFISYQTTITTETELQSSKDPVSLLLFCLIMEVMDILLCSISGIETSLEHCP